MHAHCIYPFSISIEPSSHSTQRGVHLPSLNANTHIQKAFVCVVLRSRAAHLQPYIRRICYRKCILHFAERIFRPHEIILMLPFCRSNRNSSIIYLAQYVFRQLFWLLCHILLHSLTYTVCMDADTWKRRSTLTVVCSVVYTEMEYSQNKWFYRFKAFRKNRQISMDDQYFLAEYPVICI